MFKGDTKKAFSTLLFSFMRFFSYAREDLSFIILTLFTILGIAITNTVMIWLIGTPFDLIQRKEFTEIYWTIFIFALVVIINQGFHGSEGLLSRWLGLRFTRRLRSVVFSHVLLLSSPILAKYAKGDLLARLSADIDDIRELTLEVPFYLASHIFVFLFYTAMLLWINYKLALIALAISPVFVLLQLYFGPRKHYCAKEFLSGEAKVISLEEEALEGLRDISAFGAEKLIRKQHDSLIKKAIKWGMKEDRLDIGFNASLTILIYLCGLIVMVAGVYSVARGELSAGHLVSFLLFLGYLSVPIREVAGLVHQAQGHSAAASRVEEILDTCCAVSEKDSTRELLVKDGTIEIKKLSFSYQDKTEVFCGANLKVKGGDTVALVGSSGSGKSTLVKLLLRFYEADKGTITIDGIDIKESSLASLRKNIAVVWQEPFLISDTIRANLIIANPSASAEELVNACKASNAWEFIEKLPDGLDTKTGLDGVELSSGQRQRIAIAQAFLRNAPILILDEASSALDSHNEELITKAVEELRRERTTFIIAHRYSSIKGSDYIAYFNEDGTITTGSQEELSRTIPNFERSLQWQAELANEEE